MKILLIMLGGSIGAICRWGLGLAAARVFGTAFPYGTFLANLSGCFLIGFLFEAASRSHLITPNMQLFLITGFIGALTTFSTFALETIHSANMGAIAISLLNVLLNNLAGLALVVAGMVLAKMI